jgi:hypothetical protein
MAKEAAALAKLYFEKIGEEKPSNNWKKTMVQKMEYLLDEYGATESLIQECIEENANGFEALVKKKHQGGSPKPGKNLLKPGQFYYHPMLQEAPPAPTITINSDGSFTESYASDEFYLKMKEYFDIGQAIEYLADKIKLRKYERNEGQMRYVYENKIIPVAEELESAGINPVDLLLFTIDAAYNILTNDTSKELKLNSGIFGLSDYIDDGLEIYKDKINFCRLSDISHVY